MIKLNLGSGQNKRDGYVNVDKFAMVSPDVVWDLEVFPWPFETGCADEIVLTHVLEHIGATADGFMKIMQELYRVSAADGTILVTVPHPRSDDFVNDPTHVRAVNPAIFALFSKKNNIEWKETGVANTPLALYADVDFEVAQVNYVLTPHWGQKMDAGELTREALGLAIDTHLNVVKEMNITLKVRKDSDVLVLRDAA